MPDRGLPARPNLEQYKKQAKELLRDASALEPTALARFHKHHPRVQNSSPHQPADLTLADAQIVLAREHGFNSWPAFAKDIETLRIARSVEDITDPHSAFLTAGCADPHSWHGGGSLDEAEAILARHPEVATASIYTAAALADELTVRAWIARDPSLTTTTGGPHQWDALTHLCFSRYLRIDKARSGAFVTTARTLLSSGASANTGFTEYIDTPPRPLHESVIYGAAGLAQNPALTQLLLDHGADPNDEETPYHVPETYDNTVLEILLRSGRFNQTSLATVAARKCDWHDDKGLGLALDHGADPNYLTRWKFTPFQQSIRRDNGLIMIEDLLDHGADPYLPNNQDGRNAFQMAAHHGRGDILQSLARRGFAIQLDDTNGAHTLDSLVAACARADLNAAQSIAARNPQLRAHLISIGGTLLARFAGADNPSGVRCLLALGISPAALWPEGDGYWELAPLSTALHVAAWRAHHETVHTLIAAGIPVNASDARNRTALQLAVRACIDSYWKYRRQPDSVAALLAAGATADGIAIPTGYDAIDSLLRPRMNPPLQIR
jgi:ankyrin repeat protein